MTSVVVDPTGNFLLSGSPDSNIHVWSLPALLSFVQPSSTDPTQPPPRSPLRSLAHHRAPITHLVVGHGSSAANIAVSASQDNTCVVWDYHAGVPLKTFLLPATPLCLALDPADRAVYAGREDGGVQLLDFYKTPTSLANPLYDPAQQSTPSQASPTDLWPPPNDTLGPALSLALSYDGTSLVSGHGSGKIVVWDVGRGRYVAELCDLAAPVTNLRMLSPTGFPRTATPSLTVHNVVKPRYEAALSNGAGDDGAVPTDYTFSAHFTSALDLPAPDASTARPSAFDAALAHACFPTELLDEGLRELAAWDVVSTTTDHEAKAAPLQASLDGATDRDHAAMESTTTGTGTPEVAGLKAQIAELNALVQAQHRTQKWTWEKLLELNAYQYDNERGVKDRQGDGGLGGLGKRVGSGGVDGSGGGGIEGGGEGDEMDEDEDEDGDRTP